MAFASGRVRVRYIDVKSDAFRVLEAYMIRLQWGDFEDRAQLEALAAAGRLTPERFVERFGHLVGGAAVRDLTARR
jgi:hypothetical protein